MKRITIVPMMKIIFYLNVFAKKRMNYLMIYYNVFTNVKI